jgi:coenzyme F420-reducing hydrogenase beta subunit
MGAIRFDILHQGGYYPSIDSDICVGCGKCIRACPVGKTGEVMSLKKTFAIRTRDFQALEAASSGGVFFELAKFVVDKGGFVCGAVFSDDFSVEHILSNNLDDIKNMRGSKYVESDIGTCYMQIKSLLDKGICLLFSGTPCQVAGLRSYLGRDYENLYLMDFICHGVPYEKVWLDYVHLKEIEVGAKVSSVTFRSKKLGWNPFSIEIDFKNGAEYLCPATKDPYNIGFLRNAYLKESCYSCSFKGLNVGSDFTVGDYWGAKQFLGEKVDNKGLSICICNTSKGVALINSLRDCIDIEEVAFSTATEKNPHLFYSAKRHLLKTDFFRLYNAKGAEKAFKAIKREAKKNDLKNKLNVRIRRVLKIFKRRDR